jgi:hypothetical protein
VDKNKSSSNIFRHCTILIYITFTCFLHCITISQ